MRRTLATLALLTATTLAACNDDDGTGPSGTPNLVGNWTATAIVASSVNNPSETMDLYAEGFRLTFTFGSNGSYTIVSSLPSEPVDTNSGTYSQAGSTLTLTESGAGGDVTDVTVTINGSTATFVVSDQDIDGTLANLTVTLQRQ